jgi:ATP-dependent DNA ligase
LRCAEAYQDAFFCSHDRRRQTLGDARIYQASTRRASPKAPSGDQWLHEIKYDGYRVQLHVNNDRRTIYTRTGLDWTKRFSVVAGAFDIPVERAILDGEIVVVKDGRRTVCSSTFDLLFLEGFDLRKSPQIELQDAVR